MDVAMIKIIVKDGLHLDEWLSSSPEPIPQAVGELDGRVDLWNYGRWPKRDIAKTVYECNAMSQMTSPGGFLILWVPYRLLHFGTFHAQMIGGSGPHHGWNRVGSILTYSEMGIIYRKPYVDEGLVTNYGCKKFFGEKSAQKSSMVARHLVETFCARDCVIVDASTDPAAHLAKWSKRNGVHYLGYAKNERDYEEVNNKLAQVELPLIQDSLFDDRPTNQSQ